MVRPTQRHVAVRAERRRLRAAQALALTILALLAVSGTWNGIDAGTIENPSSVTITLDGVEVPETDPVIFRSYTLDVEAPDDSDEIEVQFDDNAFAITSREGQLSTTETSVKAQSNKLTVRLETQEGFSEAMTSITIIARQGNTALRKEITFQPAQIEVRQLNVTTAGGAPPAGQLTATPGACVQFMATVTPSPLVEQAEFELTFPAEVFSFVDPQTGGECADPGQSSVDPGMITVPLEGSSEADMRVLVDPSIAATTTELTLELLVSNVPLRETEIEVAIGAEIGAMQTVAGNPVGALARMQPDQELSVSITVTGGYPEDSIVELVYQSPLVAVEGSGLTVDPDERRVEYRTDKERSITFSVSENASSADRGRELLMTIRLAKNAETLASTELRQIVAPQLSVQRQLVPGSETVSIDAESDEGGSPNPSGGDVAIVTSSMVASMVATVRNNDTVPRTEIRVVDEFDLSIFEARSATEQQIGEPSCEEVRSADGDDVAEQANADDGGVLRCTSVINEIEPDEETTLSYPIQVRAGLNGGDVRTEVAGSVISKDVGLRHLTPLPVQVRAPRVRVRVVAPEIVDPGSTSTILVTVTNTGSGAARQMTLNFSAASGADRVQQLTSSESSESKQEGDDESLTIPLGDVEPTGTDPLTYEFGVKFAESGSEAVAWQATLQGSVQPEAFPSSTTINVPLPETPDRIADEKFPMMLLTVGGSLAALLLLPLLRRWVPEMTQTTVNRLVEGVLVVFLTSSVLVMNLAGGLEAESAAAIIGGIGGYIFGRGVSQVVTERPRDAAPTADVPQQPAPSALPVGTPDPDASDAGNAG